MSAIEPRFAFATGLSHEITAPRGTLARIQEHVRHVERAMFYRTVGERGHERWGDSPGTLDVDDGTLCRVALDHDEWLDWLWERLGEWADKPPTGDTEQITPADAATFWRGTRRITVPTHRWTEAYWQSRMKDAYRLMRGEAVRGGHWGHRKLTPKEAAGVIWVIEEFLGWSVGDQRMEAPRRWTNGKLVQEDELVPSVSTDMEGYTWCVRCGAVAEEYGETNCPRKKCPVERDRGCE